MPWLCKSSCMSLREKKIRFARCYLAEELRAENGRARLHASIKRNGISKKAAKFLNVRFSNEQLKL